MLDDLLGRQDCGEGEQDRCFAEEANLTNNSSAPAEEPDCPEWRNGLTCRTQNFIGKINWIFRAITCGLKDILVQITNLDVRITELENEVKLEDIFINGNNELVEVYSDGSTQENDLSVYLDNVDTDTDTRYDNARQAAGPGTNEVTVTWDIINVDTGAVVGTDSLVIPVGDAGTGTDLFLESIGGQTSGSVPFNGNRSVLLTRSDGNQWLIDAPPSMQFLSQPALIFSTTRAKSAGSFDTGTVDFNLNSLGGVIVPNGAIGAVFRAGVSINGNQDSVGTSNSNTDGFVSIQLSNTTTGIVTGNLNSVLAGSKVVAYVDNNLGGADNDSTTDAIVPLNIDNIYYRGKIRFSSTVGNDTGTMRLYLLAFIF